MIRDEGKTKAKLISELTEQSRLNAELMQSNNSLMCIMATLADNLSEGIVVTDFNGQIIYVNKSTERYTGYSRHELIGEFPWILNGEKDADTLQQEMVSTLQRSERLCREIVQKRKDGSTYLAELEFFPVIREDGTPIAWASIQRDITKRKQVENALRESEIKYRTLVEQIPAITYVADIDEASTMNYVSPQVETLLGYSQDHFKTDPDVWLKQIHPDDRERVLADVVHCHKSNERFISEYRMFERDGRVLWFRDEAAVIRDETGQPLCLQGVMFDITERKQMEEALKESEARLRQITDNMLDMICQTNAEGIIEYISPSHKSILGYEPEDMLERSILDFVHPHDKYRVMTAVQTAIDSVSSGKIEYRSRHAHGHYLWLETIGNLLLNDNGLTTGAIFCTRDITERKQYEEALRQSEERYRKLVELSPSAIAVHIEDRIVFANKMAAKLVGADSPEELIGRSIFHFVHPDFKRRINNGIKTITEENKSLPLDEQKFLKLDGTIVDVEVTGTPLLLQGEHAIMVIARDITERKRVEEALKQSEGRYRSIVETANEGICMVDRENKIVFVNNKMATMLDCAKDQIIGSSGKFFDDKGYSIAKTSLKRRREGIQERFEFKFRRIDGSELYTIVSASPVFDANGQYNGALAMITDITLLKQAEKELRQSEERFSKAFLSSPNPMIITSVSEGKYIDVNNSFIDMTGYGYEEVLGCLATELGLFANPDDWLKLRDKLINKGCCRNVEVILRTKSGKNLVVLASADIIELNGQPCILGTMVDITKRKQIEEELRKREQFLNNIFQSIQDRLSVIDTQFNIIRTNKQVEQAYSHELPLVGKKCYKVYHGEDAICNGCPGLQAIGNCMPAHAIISVRDPSGNNIGWLDHYCYPFIDTTTGELTGAIVYARDITEKLRVEQEMARMERFHLIGQMAAGIGHEIRNPMTAVRGFLQLLGNKREYAHHKKYFELMLSELDRANSIITEYLSLARNKPVDLVEHNISTILEVLKPLLMAEAMDVGINLSIETGDVLMLPLNENEIRQLILNLVKNGLEVMEHGGKLTVQTYTDNGEVVLSVQDQGPGIKPELMDKIGTPFFTTKEMGTGLGMAVCYGIAARHNAAIVIDTGPAGTTIFVRFKLQA